MLGLMFNLVERYVIEHGAETALERALTTAGLSDQDPWLDSLRYPDADFERWLDAVAQGRDIAASDCARQIARWAAPRLLRRYSSLCFGYKEPLSLLADMPGNIYPNLHRMLGADPGLGIKLIQADPGRVQLESRAGSLICPLLEGLLLGLGDHYDKPLRILQTQCVVRGDACCQYEVRPAGAGA